MQLKYQLSLVVFLIHFGVGSVKTSTMPWTRSDENQRDDTSTTTTSTSSTISTTATSETTSETTTTSANTNTYPIYS